MRKLFSLKKVRFVIPLAYIVLLLIAIFTQTETTSFCYTYCGGLLDSWGVYLLAPIIIGDLAFNDNIYYFGTGFMRGIFMLFLFFIFLFLLYYVGYIFEYLLGRLQNKS